MEIKTTLLDSMAIDRALRRISHEIIENNKGVSNVVLLGIARGGIPICERLAENINKIENTFVPVGKLDTYEKFFQPLMISKHLLLKVLF